MNLANYSEFGLIVGALSFSSGWLEAEWLAVFAIVLSLSFVASAPLVDIRDNLYQSAAKATYPGTAASPLRRGEYRPADVSAMVFGMGGMGTAAYVAMEKDFGEKLMAVEIDLDKTNTLQQQGRNVMTGDVTNPTWCAKRLLDGLEWVLLTCPPTA